MPLILPGNVGSATAATGFDVANSLRFNDGSTDNLSRTKGTSDSTTKGTYSFWFKLSKTTGLTLIENGTASADRAIVYIASDSTLKIFSKIGNSTKLDLNTNRVFRDLNAWYNLVLAIDTTQGTASNRVKLYINGTQETSFGTETYPDQDDALRFFTSSEIEEIGIDFENGGLFDGYMCEVVKVDGSQLAPTSFGEFDEDSGIWKPIDVSGLTFGTNGFYLDFEDSSALGNDAAGSNNFTVNNLTAIDQSTDTCTNNFATFNSLTPSLQSGGVVAYSEGNTKIVTAYSNANYLRYPQAYTTLGVTSGKWYAEFKIGAIGSASVGIANTGQFGSDGSTNPYAGYAASGAVYTNGGEYRADDGSVGSQGTYTEDDIIGCALDMDNLKIYWHKNGTYINSGDPTSGATGTGARAVLAPTTPGGFYVFTAGADNTGIATIEANFGSPSYSESGGETDGNGFGNFNQSVPSGYFALCTKNLAEYG